MPACRYATTSFLQNDGASYQSNMGQLVTDTSLQLRKPRRSVSKSNYKHIPHREKPPQLVARRNARERRRVQAVNNAFSRLRRHVPYENRHKRLSKVKTLRIAIDYINYLQRLIHEYDSQRLTSRGQGGCGGLDPASLPPHLPPSQHPHLDMHAEYNSTKENRWNMSMVSHQDLHFPHCLNLIKLLKLSLSRCSYVMYIFSLQFSKSDC